MKYDIILNGVNEFYPGLNNKIYKILKVDDIKKEKFMCKIFNKFIKNTNKNIKEKHYLGIDFEFKQVAKINKEIALMQINLENDQNISYIFILYPPSLLKDNYNLLIKLISNPNMIKILHGGESLDIPYLFNQILITKENINNFCSNFYDTRYLCEYYHLINNINGKCSIYNILIDLNIVTFEKIIDLENIEKIIGPIYMITINIYNLDYNILRYSLYDVIYLPELIKKFINLGSIYSKLIPEITNIINKHKRSIDNNFNELISIINLLNIYYIYDNNYRIILKDIWEIYYYTINDKDINNLRNINYFKYFIEIITKSLVYFNIYKYFKVYKNKNEISKILDLNKYFEWLKLYPNINKIIINYNKLIITDLKLRIN